jgi:hypothetical protein
LRYGVAPSLRISKQGAMPALEIERKFSPSCELHDLQPALQPKQLLAGAT